MNTAKSWACANTAVCATGESDAMPGLVVDRYGDVLVAEILTAGMEKQKEAVTAALKKIFRPKGILYRADSAFRALEGLGNTPETVGEVPETVQIEENGVKYEVPLLVGQKTGFYYDQRENRAFLKPYFKDKLVLDLYSYIGSFGLTAALAGAAQVWGCDSSAAAVEFANKNADLNGVKDLAVFHRDDAERVLSAMKKKELPDQPDLFCWIRRPLPKAARTCPKPWDCTSNWCAWRWKDWKRAVIWLFPPVHTIFRANCLPILSARASANPAKAPCCWSCAAGQDHPVLIGMPETEYLHFALLKVC